MTIINLENKAIFFSFLFSKNYLDHKILKSRSNKKLVIYLLTYSEELEKSRDFYIEI